MERGLVSIITPCLNGQEFVKRYLDSILNQTYKNLELIFVNDGSTDLTEQIVLSYKQKFEDKGIKLIHIYQENKGLAEAINTGLKVFNGEYLIWPDADDTLVPSSIEKRVGFLNKNKDYGLVRSEANIIDDKTNKIIGAIKGKPKQDIFEDLIFDKTYLCCGCYMIRTEEFLQVVPNKHLYGSKSGQNWQILLPITRKYKCGYIQEKLYNYYIREDSHSHIVKGFEAEIERTYAHHDILSNVLKQINEYENYEKRLHIKYIRKRFIISCKYNMTKDVKQYYLELKKEKAIDSKVFIVYYKRVLKSFFGGKNDK